MVPKNQMQFASDLPYPEIQVAGKNPMYGRAMLDNMGGRNSEMTAISTYFYANLVTCGYEEVSEIFQHIMVVEMHHLKIFGKLALCLGENPRLWTYRGHRTYCWSPGYCNYPLELKSILQNALSGEYDAVKKYEQQTCVIQDANIVENLNRILLDEKIHIQIYEMLLQEFCGC